MRYFAYLVTAVILLMLTGIVRYETGYSQNPPPKVQIKDDLTVGSAEDQERLRPGSYMEGAASANQAFQQTMDAMSAGGPGGTGEPSPSEAPKPRVTYKEGWRKKGASRIYDAVDGRMIINDVVIRPYGLERQQAIRKYDNGTHGDEVPRDGVPSRVLVNSTDYIGPRTAANYDELKGILYSIGAHLDGPQKFFDLPLVSLEWDAADIPMNPEIRTKPGVYRLTSLEKRMFAFIMRDSLEIMKTFQSAEGRDLVPLNDSVSPPTGLGNNRYQARRESRGVETWNLAIRDGRKVALEKRMLAALAGSELADASWFPGTISALQLAQYRSGSAQVMSSMGLGGAGMGVGAGMGGMGMGGGLYPGMGMGMGMGAGGGMGMGGGMFPGGGFPSVPMGMGGASVPMPMQISPMGSAMGFSGFN